MAKVIKPKPKARVKNETSIVKQEEPKTKAPFTQKQVTLITRTVAKGADVDELHLFLYTANKVGLDPLARQIYFTKYKTSDGPQMAIITGIDGYRAIAERSGTYAGSSDPVYDKGYSYEPGKEPSQPSSATVTVKRVIAGQTVDFTATARWKEYYPGEKKGFMWKKMPYLMLGKVAEALALRKAFPNDLSGLKTADEMGRAGEPIDIMPESGIVVKSPRSANALELKNNIKTQKEQQKNTEIVGNRRNSQKQSKGATNSRKIIEGEVAEKKEIYYCSGCDIDISKSDAELSKQLSVDGKPYCGGCLSQYRK